MFLLELPPRTQISDYPTPPAMVRFFDTKVVSTLPHLKSANAPIDFEHVDIQLSRSGELRVEVRVDGPLQFRAAPGDFFLNHDDDDE